MPRIALPQPGHPYVLLEPDGEDGVLALDPAAIAALYRKHGAILLRGFGANVASFGSFARQFCATSVVNESPGREPLDPAGGVWTVNGGSEAFALHPELSRQPWKPDAAFFACLSEGGSDGATTICDGIELVRALPDEVRRLLAARRLLYAAPASPGVLAYWLGHAEPSDAVLTAPPSGCPYKFVRDYGGRVVRFFTRPALHKPMFSDDPAFGNFLLFARYNNGRRDFPLLDDLTPVPDTWVEAAKAAGDATMVPIHWQRGDLLMLDNTRFMHGRTAINTPEQRRIATWFGYLRFAVPNPEEPVDPIWRREDFAPPV